MQEADPIKFYSLAEISKLIAGFVQFCIRKWLVLLLAAAVGAGIGFLYYKQQKSRYEAASNFILEEKQGGMGNLGGIASQFGFDLGGLSGGGGLFSGDNILEILQSKKVVFSVLRTNQDSTTNLTLADQYLSFSGLAKRLQAKLKVADLSIPAGIEPLPPIKDSVLTIIYEQIKKKHLHIERTNKKGSIIQVMVSSPDNNFSRLLSERLVEEAGALYLSIKNQSALSNIARMQRRSDSLLLLLNGKSYNVAAQSVLDANPGIKSSLVPVEIASRDKAVITALYTEVTKNLEASKLILSQQTPVIQVLDRPALLLPDKKKGLLFVTAVAAFVLTVMTIAVLFIRYLSKNLRPV